MSNIHYFQRYSSLENTVTNNTLLLFARIYDYSPTIASTLLSELTGEGIHIGVEVAQQLSAKESVPDGVIIQRSFKILIEAKVDSKADTSQLLKHAEGFANESQKILLLLTKQPLGEKENEIASQLKAISTDIIFKNITYETICDSIRGLFHEHEASMKALAEDYIEYCNDVKLSDQSRYLMRVVPCGESIQLNKKYQIYFQRSDRGYSEHKFIGIYANKTVQAVIEIQSVFDVDLKNDLLSKVCVQGENTNEYDESIRSIIKEAEVECQNQMRDYRIGAGHRFFCGRMVETDFRKVSKGGVPGARFINLKHKIQGPYTLEAIANNLRNAEWE